MFNLQGKVALITGARRGMGRTHALALAAQGATVVVTDVDQNECQVVVGEVEAQGGIAACFKLDVSKHDEVNQVFGEVIKRFGRLDILVNNAGIYSPKPFLEMTEADWDRTININLKGQFLCAQRAAFEMAKQKWGRIINIASIASGQVGTGIAGGAHYTASKGGVIGMSETLALELAPYGITVNVVAPGAIDTPMASSANMPQGVLDGLMAKIPLHRMGRPEEVSAAVVFLASEESSYMTGSTMYVDGGWLAA